LFSTQRLERRARAIEADLAKARAIKDSERVDRLRVELLEYSDEIKLRRSRTLLREAERFYIHIPDLQWERGTFVDRYLTEASESKLYYAIKEQKDKNREYRLKLAGALIGIIGALIGLIAIWKK